MKIKTTKKYTLPFIDDRKIHESGICYTAARAVAFNKEDAETAFGMYRCNVVLCVKEPRCEWVTNIAEVHRFFENDNITEERKSDG